MPEVGEPIKIKLSDIPDATLPPPAGGTKPGDRLVLTMDDIPPEGKELLGDDQVWFGRGDNGVKKGNEKWPFGEAGFGKDDIYKLKEKLKIPDLYWPVTLVVDNSPSQATNIKAKVLHRVAGKLIHALGLGMKQSEVPVIAFANRMRNLDPITENNADNYAGGETSHDGIVKTGKKFLSFLRSSGRGSGENTLGTLTASGEFTYFHQIYAGLRMDGVPKVLVVVTDGRFSDDWDTIKHHLDWLEANDNPPMHITFVDVDENGNDFGTSQPPNMLGRIKDEGYSFVNIIQGTEVADMAPEAIAENFLESLSAYAHLLQKTTLTDRHGHKTDKTVLGPNNEWNGTFEPWTASYTPPTDKPDYINEFKK